MNYVHEWMEEARAMAPELRAIRRDLHQYPEPGWLELRTSSRIARRLSDLGFQVLAGGSVTDEGTRMGLPSPEAMEAQYQWARNHGADPEYLEAARGGHTGVVGILDCGPGPTVALRFDIDALMIRESDSDAHLPRREGFASKVPGVMHACGHDGHTTIGLGTAQLLAAHRDQLHGKVILIFQPAEEGVRGAKSVVAKGHLDHVDYLIGTHMVPNNGYEIWPGMRGGQATTKLDARFRGQSAHAGIAPQLGKSAMLAAATAVLNLNAIPRHGQGQSRINVGTIRGGSSRNAVCDDVKLELEVRGETSAINDYMEQSACRVLECAAKMYECSLELRYVGSARPLEISPDFTQWISETVANDLGLKVDTPKNTPGSEDFSFMTEHVLNQGGKACFVGVAVPCAGNPHTDRFDFDEEGLVLGVQMYTGVLGKLLQGEG